MAEQRKIIRETDDAAIRQARTLIATARHAALAVLVPRSGHPGASRVALATDFDGTPLILVSALSWHTRALQSDPRCSLLAGEPGKGDPLAHPRITLFARARHLPRDGDDGIRARRRYLARQPKAALYADFGDFSFFRLEIESASLNGGFGKAYELTAKDLAMRGDAEGVALIEEGAVTHMNNDHGEALQIYARTVAKSAAGRWRLATLDSEGIDLARDERNCRVWYPEPLDDASQLRDVLAEMARAGRQKQDQLDE